MRVEYGFAKSLGKAGLFSIEDMRQSARRKGIHKPSLAERDIGWENVMENRLLLHAMSGREIPDTVVSTKGQQLRRLAYTRFWQQDLKGTRAAWMAQDRKPEYPFELAVASEALAEDGDESALKLIERLRLYRPAEADLILARLLWRKGDSQKAYDALKSGIMRIRENPWFFNVVVVHAVLMASQFA